jgi:uncharacterized protein YbjT (DUF2867 family)
MGRPVQVIRKGDVVWIPAGVKHWHGATPTTTMTQFFEFLKGLADISVVDGKVHLPPVLFQPMAADDVASAVGRIAVGPPVNGIVEIGGPEQFRVDELVRQRRASLKDPREVVADPNARYSGAKISEKTLIPGNNARLGETRFETWLTQPAAQIPKAA